MKAVVPQVAAGYTRYKMSNDEITAVLKATQVVDVEPSIVYLNAILGKPDKTEPKLTIDRLRRLNEGSVMNMFADPTKLPKQTSWRAIVEVTRKRYIDTGFVQAKSLLMKNLAASAPVRAV